MFYSVLWCAIWRLNGPFVDAVVSVQISPYSYSDLTNSSN